MCSKRCAKPVRPGASRPVPTWYQTYTATSGSEWSSCTTTLSPLGRVKVSAGTERVWAVAAAGSSNAAKRRGRMG